MTRPVLLALLALAGCDWSLSRMNDQPRCEPGDRTPWLPDYRCDQDPPPGTVPWRPQPANPPAPPVTLQSITRGADRYARMCAACHGLLGDSNTPVARDMVLRPPPSLHDEIIVGYTDERIYEVITSGYGLMPAYSWQLTPADRWHIVHYVRVLQRSQATRLAELPPQRRQEAASWLK